MDISEQAVKIKRNSYTGGYMCAFYCNGEPYYASVCCTFDNGNECMIFPCYKNEINEMEIDFSIALYQNNNVEITKECLKECIKDFVEKEWKTLAKSYN